MKIVVLHDLHSKMEKPRYLLQYLAREWVQSGHEVTYFNDIAQPFPAADIVFLHVDLTQVPEHILKVLPQTVPVVNQHIVNISKTLFSEICLKKGDRYPHPVIVKTLQNYGAIPEKKERAALRAGETHVPKPDKGGLIRKWVKNLRKTINSSQETDWKRVRWMKLYQVFQSNKVVPVGVWKNHRLMVEKFLPEKTEDGYYLLREWVVFGDREVHSVKYSSESIAKSRTTVKKESLPLSEVPQKLRDIRERLQVDFAKFDYVMHEGEAILLDINKTVSVPESAMQHEQSLESIRYLSSGIEYFFKDMAS